MLDPAAIRAAPAPPRGPNLLALLAGIWFRPGRTLRAVATGPGWLWAVPLLLAVTVAVGAGFATVPAREAAQSATSAALVEARIRELPPEMRESPPEEITQVPEPSRVLMLWVPLAVAVAGIVLGWLVRAAVLHVSSLALGGQQSFGQVYGTSAWASFPLILRSAVQALYAVAGGGLVDRPGLSGLLSVAASPAAPSGVLASTPVTLPAIILGRIDLYSIWYLVLLVFAVGTASKLPRGKALVLTAIYAVLSILAGLGQLLTRGITGG